MLNGILGGITFTGSIVAFLKLAGRMSSKPLALPGKHVINSAILGSNAIAMVILSEVYLLQHLFHLALQGSFVAAAPAVPAIAAAYLGASTLLSFVQGFTTTAAIGGADMRMAFAAAYSLLNLIGLFTFSGRHNCIERIFWLCISRRRRVLVKFLAKVARLTYLT